MVDEATIVEEFVALARGKSTTLIDFLPAFQEAVTVPDTSTLVRTHFIAHDANGVPAVEKLAGAMAAATLDFCIPRSKIQRAVAELEETGSTAAIVSLQEQARDLFVKSESSGEGGELLLFLLMERVLQRPQLISKMALKTNTAMHVHGSDGIHASLADDGTLDVYWGESKLYKSSSDAFKECFDSIAPYLRPNGDSKRKQDLLLVRDHLNVTQIELAAHLLEYFDETNPKSLKARWNGVCLVGFDHDNYPNIATLDDAQRQAVSKAVQRWHETVGSRLKEFDIVGVNIDLFCIPMPDVADLRARVLKRMGAK
ncbi:MULTISPECIES: HamA C-terminal domain-containing protein [unclassified Microbacterium]|uniref:HamA C-terminal domain-containing protein n=1 Tax=unclassified Microbacterium TaxID=2609290 RepID=UPI0030175A9F